MLNDVYKQDYEKMILEEDDFIREYTHQVQDHLMVTADQTNELMMGIEDTNEVWNEA
jgi:hypothetical protein